MSTTEKFISILERNGWKFFHFTDTRNIPSIKEVGLLSMAELRRRGILPITGGNQWSLDADIKKGMDTYVHLCFFSGHPMEYIAKKEGRIETSRFLKVAPGILRTPGALVSKDVSNRATASYAAPDDIIEDLDLQVIYTRMNWKDPAVMTRLKAAKKCEILIPSTVPVEYITNT